MPPQPALMLMYLIPRQEGLYTTLQQSVDGFRVMVGAPDSPRWNAVLFGGS